jgi:hypothetical protein
VPTGWIIGGVAVVAVAVAALVWSAREPEPAQPVVPTSAAPSIVAPPSAPSSAPPGEPASSEAMPPALSVPSATPARVDAPRAAPPRESNLAEESALISRARTELASSPAQTLATIDDHARRFPRGELAAEREYLRVSALRRLGRNDEARTRGQRYLTLFPTSPYASSVRTILRELGEP